MNLHLVGGFLGSGKTTAIVGAAKRLLAQGRRVGVVTNDQGRFLVDTAFFRLADLPAVEVTGGCFCCNYDDLDARLEQIVAQHPERAAQARPDVVFAESVGSCADLVATVVKPLLSLGGGRFAPTSFSVFADARLLRRRLLGLEMPFSEDVVYIFDQQLQEAGLLVVNKADLLPPAELEELGGLVAERFPGCPILFQDSLLTRGGVWSLQDAVRPRGVWPYAPTGHAAKLFYAPTGQSSPITGISEWVEQIEGGALDLRAQQSLEMDYARYGAGEAGLAWLDEGISLDGDEVSAFIRSFLGGLADSLRRSGAAVGHIKLLVRPQGKPELKLSLTAGDLDAPSWAEGLPELAGPVRLILNARVQMPVEKLRIAIRMALEAAGQATTTAWSEAEVSCFHPGFPHPTHRM